MHARAFTCGRVQFVPAIKKQHDSNKMTARERLLKFYDAGTFQEVQLFVEKRSTLFGLGDKSINADAVVCVFGILSGGL